MKHEQHKEWYTCDRCGMKIDDVPTSVSTNPIKRLFKCKTAIMKHFEVKRFGSFQDVDYTIPEIASVTIEEHYQRTIKEIHLCGRCRKDFERFMNNGQNPE